MTRRKCVVCAERDVPPGDTWCDVCVLWDENRWDTKNMTDDAALRARAYERRRWLRCMRVVAKQYRSFDVASAFDDVVAEVRKVRKP